MHETLWQKSIFGWEHFHIYLSGAIDFDREGGRNWREEWSEKLENIGFEPTQIFNPCKKPLPAGAPFDLDDEAKIMRSHRERHEWKELCEVLSQIAHVDLRLVDKCDIVLVNMLRVGQERFKAAMDHLNDGLFIVEELKKKYPDDEFTFNKLVHKLVNPAKHIIELAADQRVPTYGTLHEIVVARQQRKPVYLVWEGGKETCSAWLMWLVGHNNVFGTVDELITRLDNIAKGKTSYNAKDWLLLDLDHDGVV